MERSILHIKKCREKLKGTDLAVVLKAEEVRSRLFGYFSRRLPAISAIATQTPLAITIKAPIITRIRIINSIFYTPDLFLRIQCPSAYARSAAPRAGIIINGGISTSEGYT